MSKKIVAFMLVITITLSGFALSSIPVRANELNISNVESVDSTQGIVADVLIFVGGILVAFILDGVLIYATGKSGGEWVSTALTYIRDHPGVKEVHIDSNGGVHGGGSHGFDYAL